MQTKDFTFELPEQLIAKTPPDQRGTSRLLCLDGQTGQCRHQQFPDIIDELVPGDLLVFNDTRVIPARLFGHKASGGKVELLIERVLSDHHALAHIKASKSPKPGTVIWLNDSVSVEVTGRSDSLFEISSQQNLFEIMEAIGHMPLPPYIDREDTLDDRERYQTVYGKHLGAVAAPTAGLHFDENLLAALADKGVEHTFVTLHVGAGTFQPVRVDDVKSHIMHSERMVLSEESAAAINLAKAQGRRVVAIGTTSVRCLETAAAHSQSDSVEPYSGETDIFIYPGFHYQVVDLLLTNFHLPESTLLMLVSAFVGFENTMAAYREAVAQQYRFFSYGDAMLISPNPNAVMEARNRWPEIVQ